MVENGVREEIKHLKDRIVNVRAYFLHLQKQIDEIIAEQAFYKAALVYHKKTLERTKGADEEKEARESVKNAESWVEEYEKLARKNEDAVMTSRNVLERLEKQLKELKGGEA